MGHRQCLGKPLAEALISLLVVYLLRKYEIGPAVPPDSEEDKVDSGAWSTRRDPLIWLEPL